MDSLLCQQWLFLFNGGKYVAGMLSFHAVGNSWLVPSEQLSLFKEIKLNLGNKIEDSILQHKLIEFLI